MFKKVPGTKDIVPEEAFLWQKIEDTSRAIFSHFNFREIRTPIIEDISLFNRSLGEFTEIVQKQMFLIPNKEDTYVLRPEGTASVVRAYLENNLDKTEGFVKLYYMGPMFRLERPQKGRMRQFHHIGAEAIGSFEPGVDVELISLADRLLKSNGIAGYKIMINSLGCPEDKAGFVRSLEESLKSKQEILCDDCKVRFGKNVLRILDCKVEACKQIVAGFDFGGKNLCGDCVKHFEAVQSGLKALEVDFEVNPLLVRGLDYYTRTVFEITHSGLGSQDALGAGGRYDTLVAELGGPSLGAFGFAFGVERLLLARNEECSGEKRRALTYLVTLGERAQSFGMRLLFDLRSAGIASDTDYNAKSLKGAMRRANDLGARFVLIIGDNELDQSTVMLKDMSSGEQKQVNQSDIVDVLLHHT